MVKYEKKEVTTHIAVSKECDVCHKVYHDVTVTETENPNELWEFQEFHHLRFRGGFGSVFGDESLVECDICQHCLKKLLGQYLRIDE